ncbi:MAG: hypothetical protein CL675_11290 [Bdellovibrionaceae bacterium]|nr:hypothetical protein [Pseudobdellovibrionaceae bacterium]
MLFDMPTQSMQASVQNYMTIDTEDWFQVFYANDEIPLDSWSDQESRLSKMLDRSLKLLDQHNTKATFFCVAWLAEKHPALIKALADAGHEIGCHTYWHLPLNQISVEQFKDDITKAKKLLEDVTGQEVIGFRAPGYSLKRQDQSYIDVIEDVGFKYDSSIVGPPSAPYKIGKTLVEIPATGLKLGAGYYPANGGTFFRFLTFSMYKSYVRSLNRKGHPLNFYTHTWELYTDYPQVIRHPIKRLIQYHNLNKVHDRMDQLMQEFPFTSIQKACFQS